ncbi:MAG: hypothetical protein ACYCO0_05085 [Candidatus Micrarchaeaceae archaeon]
MEVQPDKEQDKATRTQAYAEALDFFIENPKAITDPTLKVFVDFFKERIAQEEERSAKGLGTQRMLANELV